MTVDWSPLRAELAAWRAENRVPGFWWRDDDAVAETSALSQLTELAMHLEVPAHLAVIPKHATASLVEACAAQSLLVPLVHGWSHENHAPEGQKKDEFGHPRTGLQTDAVKGLALMDKLFGHTYLPCFVPPWNRIDPIFAASLPALGYTCLSTFTPRMARLAAPGLVQINTHIDPIHWRGGRGLVETADLIALTTSFLRDRRARDADLAEPLGLLTHHLVHDRAIWAFAERFMQTLLDGGARPINLFEMRKNLP